MELDRVQSFLHQRGEVFILIGFHVMVLFQDMTEQLFKPSTEEMIDANVRRQLLQLVGHFR